MFGNILVVDDEMDWRDFLHEVFTQVNYNVTTLPSEKEVIEYLKTERPEYLFIDAGTNESLKVIEKTEEIDKNIRIVALATGEYFEKSRKLFSDDSRITVLDKDIDKSKLMQSIFDILKEVEIERVDKEPAFKGSILIVDDEREANVLIGSYFERRGYNILSAFSGEEAILKTKMHKPQVVILDIKMKGIDGLLILKHIKEIDKSIIVIMTSGISDEQVVKDCMKTGAAAYLTKPFNLSKLEAVILANTLLNKPAQNDFINNA
jgi:two-component system, response regulator, stage 0 sporulation protein F